VEKRINGLENKIAMITSAARGIARAFAEADVRARSKLKPNINP
jgi:NAD(P)-dependent dehydrogenase (short-subunit alcohol dehydrogenase family)